MFEYRRPSSWCPFLICTEYTVSGSVELDCEYICHLDFASWRSSWTRNDP